MKTFLLLLAFAACCVAAPFPVAENGKPVAEIVIDADADIVMKHAGEELRHWLKEITGAELPLLSQAGAAPRRIRLTTAADVLAKYPADAERLKGNEGYAVRPDGDVQIGRAHV